MTKIAIMLIEFYQKFLSFDTGVLSVFAPQGVCRNTPRCSEYTKQMIIQEGLLMGIFRGGKRIVSCR